MAVRQEWITFGRNSAADFQEKVIAPKKFGIRLRPSALPAPEQPINPPLLLPAPKPKIPDAPIIERRDWLEMEELIQTREVQNNKSEEEKWKADALLVHALRSAW